MKDRLIIYKSKKKAFLIIIAGVVLAGISFLAFIYARDNVSGWIFLLLSIFISILGMSDVQNRKPQIIITAKGITEPYSIKEEIEWDAVRSVDDLFFRGQDFVRIILPIGYKPGLINPKWFWRFDRIYEQQGLKAVYIRVSGLGINSRQLTTIIENMAKTDSTRRSEYLHSVEGLF